MSQEKAYKIPIAHGEGRFFAPENTIKQILDDDSVLFKYCSENGEINDNANPNGSLHNIAGITNKNKNIFGMMPHPERASSNSLNNSDGLSLFHSLLNNC